MRTDLFAPVVTPAHRLVLRVVTRDDFRHRVLRTHTCLDSIVLGWQTKGIPANRMIALIALLTLVTCHDVADRIVHSVADMDTRTAGVIKHAHGDIFGFVAHEIGGIDASFIPYFTPFWFDLCWVVTIHDAIITDTDSEWHRALWQDERY